MRDPVFVEFQEIERGRCFVNARAVCGVSLYLDPNRPGSHIAYFDGNALAVAGEPIAVVRRLKDCLDDATKRSDSPVYYLED